MTCPTCGTDKFIKTEKTPADYQTYCTDCYDCDFNGVSYYPTVPVGCGKTKEESLEDWEEEVKEIENELYRKIWP